MSVQSSPYRDRAHLQGLLTQVFAYPYPGDEAGLLTRKGLSVGFSFRTPDLEVLLDGRPGQHSGNRNSENQNSENQVAVSFGVAVQQAPRPELRFSMSGGVAHPFWMGDLNVVAAMTVGQIRLEGPLLRALSIAPMMPAMQRVYRELWAAQGAWMPPGAGS